MTAGRSRAQTEHARAYCARKRWLINEDCIYVNDGISGAEFERRLPLVRLVRDVGQTPRPPSRCS